MVGRTSMKSQFFKHLKRKTEALIEYVGCGLLISQLQPLQMHCGCKCLNPDLSVLTSSQSDTVTLLQFGGDF